MGKKGSNLRLLSGAVPLLLGFGWGRKEGAAQFSCSLHEAALVEFQTKYDVQILVISWLPYENIVHLADNTLNELV